jgi:hypothetical protein
MGEMRSANNILVETPERRRQLKRSKHRWKDITEMHFREIRFGACI